MVSEEAGQQLDPPDPSASGRPYRAHLPALPTWPLHFTLTSYWPPFSLPFSSVFTIKKAHFTIAIGRKQKADWKEQRVSASCAPSFSLPGTLPGLSMNGQLRDFGKRN